MHVSRDKRRMDFRGLTGSQRTPRVWGVTELRRVTAYTQDGTRVVFQGGGGGGGGKHDILPQTVYEFRCQG